MSFFIGFNSRHVLMVDMSLPPVAAKVQPANAAPDNGTESDKRIPTKELPGAPRKQDASGEARTGADNAGAAKQIKSSDSAADAPKAEAPAKKTHKHKAAGKGVSHAHS